MTELDRVCVFCGSSVGTDLRFRTTATEVPRLDKWLDLEEA